VLTVCGDKHVSVVKQTLMSDKGKKFSHNIKQHLQHQLCKGLHVRTMSTSKSCPRTKVQTLLFSFCLITEFLQTECCSCCPTNSVKALNLIEGISVCMDYDANTKEGKNCLHKTNKHTIMLSQAQMVWQCSDNNP